MTSDMDAAIVELRAACKRAYDAQKAKKAALARRRTVAEQTWKYLFHLGPKGIVRHMGGDAKMRATVRSLTADLTPRPPRGPNPDVALNKRQQDAITKLRKAIEDVDKASQEHSDALTARWHAIRKTWPVLAPMGQRAIAHAVGGGFVGESTISVTTMDLRNA